MKFREGDIIQINSKHSCGSDFIGVRGRVIESDSWDGEEACIKWKPLPSKDQVKRDILEFIIRRAEGGPDLYWITETRYVDLVRRAVTKPHTTNTLGDFPRR